MRIVVLGGGFGFRKQLQVALGWGIAQFFPRDSAIMRPVSRCPVCRRHARERDAP